MEQKFPIEIGRWNGIPKNERICHLCHTEIGDEFHFLFICQKEEIKVLREKFIPNYYVNFPSRHKLYGILRNCHVELYKNLANFLKLMIKFL